MALHGYEEVDHTADIAIRAWGENFHALLCQAADGLYDLMGVEIIPNTADEVLFSLPQGSNEDILVDFLNELLYLVEQKNQRINDISFEENDEEFKIQARGSQISSQARQIKAVTFHNLSVEETLRGYEVIITFDV